jgi:transcription initiation protein SPT3
MTPAKKTTTASADVSEKKKEYKYQQEISQMVRTWKTSPTLLPTVYGCFLQMFVFGEIQEPLTETVNLVENIIRSQLIELV